MATGQFPLKFNIISSVIDAQIGMFTEDQEQLRIIGMKTMFSMFVKLWKYGTHAKKYFTIDTHTSRNQRDETSCRRS